jgi:hypothetical protein
MHAILCLFGNGLPKLCPLSKAYVLERFSEQTTVIRRFVFKDVSGKCKNCGKAAPLGWAIKGSVSGFLPTKVLRMQTPSRTLSGFPGLGM